MTIFNFDAKIGGDNECFCFFVDKDTFIHICGEQAYQDEIKYNKELCQELDMEYVESNEFKIYPDQFFKGFNRCNVTIITKPCYK